MTSKSRADVFGAVEITEEHADQDWRALDREELLERAIIALDGAKMEEQRALYDALTESTEASGIEYSEVFIGDCGSGSCTRPATARVYEDFVLCALHHALYEAGEAEDDATLALELINGWHSIANMHNHEYLIRLFNVAEKDLRERLAEARRRMVQLERADHESQPNEEIRLQMGRQASKQEQEEASARHSSR